MPVISCQKCPARLKLPDGVTGITRCPKCGAVFPFGTPATPALDAVEGPPAPVPEAPVPLPRKPAVKAGPDFEVVDERPKKRVAAFTDDDENDRPRKKRTHDDEDEDGEPKTRKKRYRQDDEDEDEEPRAKKRRRRDEDDEGDEYEEDDRPRKKKKRRSRTGLVLALAGIGLALLLLVGGLLWLFWPNGVGANVRYLPDNSQIVASIKLEEFLGSKAYKQIKDEFPKAENDLKPEKEIGLALEDISSVLVGGGKTGDKPDFVIVIQTKKSVRAEDLLGKIKDNKYTQESVGGYAIYVRGKDAFCVAESKVVVLSEPETLRKVLKRDGKPNFSDGMSAAIKEADFSKTIAVAVNVKELTSLAGKGGNGIGLPLDRAADEYLKNVEGFGGWASVKTDINGRFTAVFKDEKAAADGKKLLDGLSVMAKNAKIVPAEAVEFLEHLECKLSGNRVEVVWAIEVTKLIKLARSAGPKF